eukprot:GFUD01022031.1.p1 GENE.GFUD01022031.1~~GFUD01022031.1.p1  ORF type:complete len:408 (+),score=59.43 GFUD01022031.1:35-1258(+)
MFAFSNATKHELFLQAGLRENADKFADVRICCSDGSVKQNRIFLGILETYLQKLPEFCSPDAEALVMFPEISLEEYFDVLNERIFCQKSGNTDGISCSGKLLTDLSQDGLYEITEDYEVVSRLGVVGNMEDLEIIMHDDVVVSEERDNKNQLATCEICDAKVEKTLLSQHLKVHVKKYKCNYCDKTFSREKAFLAHKSNYHNENVQVEAGKKPLLTCGFCCAKFEAPVQLENHLRSHTKSKPFQCSVCNKCFVSKSNLSAHQRLHEGTALRYACSQCEKKFSHPSEVKQHMVVHTGIRAYTCNQCGNKYSRYPSLWKHLKKCTYTKKIVLVQPLNQQSKSAEMFLKPSGSDKMYVSEDEDPLGIKTNNTEDVEVAGESVVVDEIIVTDGIGNEIMLPDDSFSLESAL